MILQKMKYGKTLVICAVNRFQHGKEYTFCGNIYFNSVLSGILQ